MPKKEIKESLTSPEPQKRPGIKWFVFLLLVAVVVAGVMYLKQSPVKDKSISKSSYQAVFLSNGQVYFGKMSVDSSWIMLKDVYYLQVTQPLQAASANEIDLPEGEGAESTTRTLAPNNSQNIQLVKLGSELHGPEDTMYLDRGHILFWENMKDDSRVIQAIKQYQQSNQ